MLRGVQSTEKQWTRPAQGRRGPVFGDGETW